MLAITPVLLVRAVEETDRSGALLPLADREHASREVLRNAPAGIAARDEPRHRARIADLLSARASRLLGPLGERYPVLRRLTPSGTSVLPPVLAPLAGLAMPAVALAGLAAGAALSALDGTHRINILALPFLLIVGWNLLVYAVLAVRWTGSRLLRRDVGDTRPAGRPGIVATWFHDILARRLRRVVRTTTGVDALLGQATARFAAGWTEAIAPLLALGVKRLFHLGAAMLAAGFIAGLYWRGLVFRYEAGWDSTFLDARQVLALLRLFGPLADLVGLHLPQTIEDVERLRISTAGGGDAAPWIHLSALLLALVVVFPRLLLAFAAWIRGRLWLRSGGVSDGLLSYARRVLGAAGAGRAGGVVSIIPYARTPSETEVNGLRRWLEGTFGRGAGLQLQPAVPYGDEERLPEMLDAVRGPDVEARALLFELAATPEAENHGVALRAVRDATRGMASPAELYVLIDQAGYAARMSADPSWAGRLEERRRLWREFVAGYGLQATFLDLPAAT